MRDMGFAPCTSRTSSKCATLSQTPHHLDRDTLVEAGETDKGAGKAVRCVQDGALVVEGHMASEDNAYFHEE